MTSSFILGTAQFGQHYGITNNLGCPSNQEVVKILECALEHDINCLDTAFAYGNSINKLGDFLLQQPSAPFNLINKISIQSNFDETYDKITAFLEKTGTENFYALLLHDPDKLSLQNIDKVLKFLEKLKEKGLTQKIGVSLYAPLDLKSILNALPIEIIQCPINLFDQRFLDWDVLQILQSKDIEIHGRSLFLQGVLLGKTLPKILTPLEEKWKLYQIFLRESHLSTLQFIMSWMRSLTTVHKWVIGVNTQAELAEILQTYATSVPLKQLEFSKLNDPFNEMIDPRNWSKR